VNPGHQKLGLFPRIDGVKCFFLQHRVPPHGGRDISLVIPQSNPASGATRQPWRESCELRFRGWCSSLRVEEEEEGFFNHYKNDLKRHAHTPTGDAGAGPAVAIGRSTKDSHPPTAQPPYDVPYQTLICVALDATLPGPPGGWSETLGCGPAGC